VVECRFPIEFAPEGKPYLLQAEVGADVFGNLKVCLELLAGLQRRHHIVQIKSFHLIRPLLSVLVVVGHQGVGEHFVLEVLEVAQKVLHRHHALLISSVFYVEQKAVVAELRTQRITLS